MPSGYIKDLEGNRIEIVDAQARSGLQGKQDKLTAGRNISISNNIISADDTTVTQTLTSGTEIGKVNDTSLFAPTVNYVDATLDDDGYIRFFGGNDEAGNIGTEIAQIKQDITALESGKADTIHSHTIADVTGLQAVVDKVNAMYPDYTSALALLGGDS